MYAIVNTETLETVTRVEAHDLAEAQILAKRYGADCTAVLTADSLIGSLAHATLEPLTAESARVPGEHVTLDARNVDHWSRNHGR